MFLQRLVNNFAYTLFDSALVFSANLPCPGPRPLDFRSKCQYGAVPCPNRFAGLGQCATKPSAESIIYPFIVGEQRWIANLHSGGNADIPTHSYSPSILSAIRLNTCSISASVSILADVSCTSMVMGKTSVVASVATGNPVGERFEREPLLSTAVDSTDGSESATPVRRSASLLITRSQVFHRYYWLCLLPWPPG